MKRLHKNNLLKSNSIFYNKVHKSFSVIHNYHSPYILWLNNNHIELDDNLNEYNEYIQAFLDKRFIHKKEIEPKIKVLKDTSKILKDYHNTFYVQIMYPIYNLILYSYMKHIHNSNIIDSAYIISRFCEEYEKPMYDAAFSKILINGRVEFMEDSEYFTKTRTEINRLIDIFYNGEKLSPFEREIERAYLTLKQNKFNELMAKYIANPKLKKQECFLTFSEKNKLNGHVNFRMKHPTYFFNPCPIFETINIEKMFYSLYEMRYNILTKFQIWEKLKLKFHYRKSLLNSQHRVEYLSYYIYLQVFQYLESWEYYNEFNLSLNFMENFNMMVLHLWFVIQRLQKLEQLNDKNSKFCRYIIENLTDRINNYFLNNIDKFQFTHQESLKITNVKKFIYKLFDIFTWHFEILNEKNNIENLRKILNDVIFSNNKEIDDKFLIKFAYYTSIHYEYFNTKTYSDLETSNFNFSINRININYKQFIINEDTQSSNSNLYEESYKEVKDHEVLLQNFDNKKKFFFSKNKIINYKNNAEKVKNISELYGINPYRDNSNYYELDVNKGIRGRVNRFIKNEMFYENAIAIEKVKKYLYF